MALNNKAYSYIEKRTDEHASESGIDYQVGDLLEVIRILLQSMTKEQVLTVLSNDDFVGACAFFSESEIDELIKECGE